MELPVRDSVAFSFEYPGGILDMHSCNRKAMRHSGRDFMTKDNETAKGPKVVRNYRDSVFRMLFKEKKELLSLFNAINGTDYDNPDELEINTLERYLYGDEKRYFLCA